MGRNQLLHALMFTPLAHGRWGLPALFIGPPGVGKTAIIEEFAAKWGLPCETLSPGERGEGAFGVTPVPSDEGTIGYPPPDWTKRVDEGGIVFVDEISCAEPALQKPLLGLIQARRVGGHVLGPRCRVIGAANPVSLATGGWDLTPAVANRLGHFDWEVPSANEWTSWLLGAKEENQADEQIKAEIEEARVTDAWANPWAKITGYVSGFITRRPELLYNVPPEGPQLSGAWPSHRSWENATRALASAEIHDLNALDRETFIAAYVGKAAANELFTWLSKADLPDPADVLDEKVKFKFDAKRLDRTMAVYSGCAALVSQPTCVRRQERSAVLWKLIDRDLSKAPDIAVPAVTILCKARLTLVDGAQSVLEKLRPALSAAGL